MTHEAAPARPSNPHHGQAMAGRQALRELIVASFERNRDASRFPLYVLTLVELGDLKSLVDIATEEWLHELDIDASI